jgi:hypothetical protein
MYRISDVPERLTPDWILLKVNQEEIFYWASGIRPEMRTSYRNPLRPEDKKPGCKFFVRSGYLWFKDFSTDEVYNCFTFTAKKNNVSYPKALDLIYEGMIKERSVSNHVPFYSPEEETTYSIIDVEVQKFTIQDVSYLKSYGLTLELCRMYNVFSVKSYWVNGDFRYNYSSYNPCIGYYFGDGKWKLYFYRNKVRRFITNCPFSHLQGKEQLKYLPDLVITKSCKDVMVYRAIGIDAVAPHGENTSEWVLQIPELLGCYENIFINFDPDTAGVKATEKIISLYPQLKPFYYPEEYKDASGYAKFEGLINTKVYFQCQQEKLLYSLQKQTAR